MRELSVRLRKTKLHKGSALTKANYSKAKKRCDQELPACGRCVRLGKACGGYRDLSGLIFKNETANVTRRASSQSGNSQSEASQSAASSSAATTRNPSPEKESTARSFFFSQFVTASHLSFLDSVSVDEFLSKPIVACATAVMANRENDTKAKEAARRSYVEAITATNAALRHPRKVREDNTLVAVSLLAVFEVKTATSFLSKLETDGQQAHNLGAKHIDSFMATTC